LIDTKLVPRHCSRKRIVPTKIDMLHFLCIIYFVKAFAASDYEVQKAASTGGTDSGLMYSTSTQYGTQGFLAKISNPVGHFHVYFNELSNGTCDGRAKTSDQAKKHKCLFATNGSPFSFNSPNCMGSLVSDGVVVDIKPSTDGYFGLTKSGNFIIGHIDESEIKGLNFDQLIMGFDWLVRKGVNSLKEGGQIAPRTIIGINIKGELLILQVDGIEEYTPPIGLTLYQAAEWALSIGGYNVLNLDGGGSSATFFNGTTVDKPTCQDTPTPICEREVTTITCII